MYLFKNKHGCLLVSQINSSGASNLKRCCMLFPQSPDPVYPLIIYQRFVFFLSWHGLKKKAQKDSDSKHIHAWCDIVTILLCSHAACFLPPLPPGWMGRLQANLCISMSMGVGEVGRWAPALPGHVSRCDGREQGQFVRQAGGLRRLRPSVGKGGDSKSQTALLKELT